MNIVGILPLYNNVTILLYALLIHRIRNARPLHRSSFPPGEEKQNNIKYYNKITNRHQQGGCTVGQRVIG